MGRTAGNGTSSPTIPDVARRAGVSTATAARALGGYGSVSDAARQRVMAAAEELGYHRNELARTMITGRSNTLGLVVADIENPFFAAAVRGASDAAGTADCEVVLVNTDEDVEAERSAIKMLLAKRVDGIVVAPASPVDVDHLVAAQQSGCPIVLLDREVGGLETDTVLVDNKSAARDVVERLVEAGHARIAMVTGGASSAEQHKLERPSVSTGRDRVDGYLEALDQAGLHESVAYLRTGAYNAALAEGLTENLLRETVPPTAIFASDSVVALGVLRALRSARLAIPQQISLVAFDDAEWTSVVAPAISVVAQPVNQLGRQAAEMLLARVQGDTAPPRRRVMGTTFLTRESVGAPPR